MPTRLLKEGAHMCNKEELEEKGFSLAQDVFIQYPDLLPINSSVVDIFLEDHLAPQFSTFKSFADHVETRMDSYLDQSDE